MLKLRFLILLFFIVASNFVNAQGELNKLAIGSWREHQNYSFIKHVEDAGDRVYASCDYSLFAYDKTEGSLTRYSKIDGLSDIEISTIAYDKKTEILVIAYLNSNIDLLVNDKVYNVSGLKNKMLEGDKTIYNITFNGNYAYLSCGFGILVIDLKRKEIKDTYVIGENGTALKINSVVINDTSIIAATEKGLLYANKNHPFLANFANWKKMSNVPDLPNSNYNGAAIFEGTLVVSKLVGGTVELPKSFLYRFNSQNNTWVRLPIYNDTLAFTSMKVTSGKLVFSCNNFIYFYTSGFNPNVYYIKNPTNGDDYFFNDAVFDSKGILWAASKYWGLFEYTKNPEQLKSHLPTGPVQPWVYKIRNFEDIIYIAPGGKNQQYVGKWNHVNLYTLKGNSWEQLDPLQKIQDTSLLKLLDLLDVCIDPNNSGKIYASTWGYGILLIENNRISKIYNDKNSSLRKEGGERLIRIPGAAFDSEGNLWVANSMVKNGLCVKWANDTWSSFDTEALMGTQYDINGIFVDPFSEYKWIIPRDKTNKIYVFNSEGKGVYIDPNKNCDLQSGYVNDLAFDLDGFVWVGTNKGIKIIYNYDNVFSTTRGYESEVTCNNIVYVEDNKVQNLLEFEEITSIVVDGANRKWVGTLSGGVFLLSSDGLEQLLHFSAENSPLPSNTIVSIGINSKTGEVFFGTDKGVVSFKSDATGFGEKNENVYVYPNPVRSNYDGPIAIKGLVRDAIVKITDVSGNLVYNTKALGGQAIWNGRNMAGKRVASGIYLVFIADIENNEKAVTKILFLK